MSAIGTILAAGVAPATQQAAQSANRRDKRVREQQRAAHRTREVFETHLDTLEDNDETDTNIRLRPDAQFQTTAQSPTPPGLELARVHRRPNRRDNAAEPHPQPSTQNPPSADHAETGSYDHTGHYHTTPRDDGHPHIDVQG